MPRTPRGTRSQACFSHFAKGARAMVVGGALVSLQSLSPSLQKKKNRKAEWARVQGPSQGATQNVERESFLTSSMSFLVFWRTRSSFPWWWYTAIRPRPRWNFIVIFRMLRFARILPMSPMTVKMTIMLLLLLLRRRQTSKQAHQGRVDQRRCDLSHTKAPFTARRSVQSERGM